jgi:hypothetical protein
MNSKSTTSDKLTFNLKRISIEGIDRALSKAEQYRLLNQPRHAESICRDILDADPGNQKASVILLLALTDQFGKSASNAVREATDIVKGLNDEYLRAYYTGINYERQGTAAMVSGTAGSDFDACEWYLEAMEMFEKANAVRPVDNDDAVLRWNTCARIIMQSNLKERPIESLPALDD